MDNADDFASSQTERTYEPQTFRFSDGSTCVWTREGESYFRDGTEVLPNDRTDAWGQYFKEYHLHIHEWEELPSGQMRHVMNHFPPPRRDDG